MYYKTSYTCMAIEGNNLKMLGLGTYQYEVKEDEFKDSLKLLNFTIQPKKKDEITKFMTENNIQNNILEKLLKQKLITDNELILKKTDTMDFKNFLYSDLVSPNPKKANENFKKTTFLILGTGGIGNFMSYALATHTPKKIILLDGDIIERSNLNRQFMFKTKDLNLLKANVLGTELKARNPELNVEVIPDFIDESVLERVLNNINGPILGILSADGTNAVYSASKVFSKYHIPFLNIGYLNDISIIGPFFIPSVSCCPYCHNAFSIDVKSNIDISNNLISKINQNFSAPSHFVNNALSTSMAMNEIIQFMSGNIEGMHSINKRFGIDVVNFNKYYIKSSIDANCKYCIEDADYEK